MVLEFAYVHSFDILPPTPRQPRNADTRKLRYHPSQGLNSNPTSNANPGGGHPVTYGQETAVVGPAHTLSP